MADTSQSKRTSLFEIVALTVVALLFAVYISSPRHTPVAASPAAPLPRDHSSVTVLFNEHIVPSAEAMIQSATTGVDVVAFTCREGRLLQALRKAARRGIRTRLVCGKSHRLYPGDINYVERSPKRGILHEKFVVVDKRSVIISTANFSDATQSNSALLFRDAPRLAHLLTDETDRLMAGVFKKACINGCPFEYGTMFFCPGACKKLASIVRSTKTSLQTALYTVTVRNPLYTALMHVIDAGTPVTLVVDDWKGERKAVNREVCVRSAYHGATALFDNQFQGKNNILLHDKLAVIDGKTVIIGSMNWTASACYRNREVVVVVHDRPTVQKLSEHIKAVSLHGKPCATGR